MNTGVKFSVGWFVTGTAAAEPTGTTCGGVPLPCTRRRGSQPLAGRGEGTRVLPGQAGLKEQIVLLRIRPARV